MRAKPGEATAFLKIIKSCDFDECLIWPFKLVPAGYGDIRIDGKHIGVHRIACEMFHGPAPSPDHEAAHSCNNRACCNGRHLRWATHKENESDKIKHGTRAIGEKHGRSRITEDVAKQIIALRGVPQKELAVRFNTSVTTVSQVQSGYSWPHLDRMHA